MPFSSTRVTVAPVAAAAQRATTRSASAVVQGASARWRRRWPSCASGPGAGPPRRCTRGGGEKSEDRSAGEPGRPFSRMSRAGVADARERSRAASRPSRPGCAAAWCRAVERAPKKPLPRPVGVPCV